jgi:Tfp pilus assembly PilM family ATPase
LHENGIWQASSLFWPHDPHLCAGLDIAPDRVRLALLRRIGRRAQLLRLTQRLTGGIICQGGQITDIDALTLICRSLLDEPGCQGQRWHWPCRSLA